MDIFLDALKKSVEHLEIIDEVFSQEKHPNQKEYLEIKERILKLNSIDPDIEFTDSLYVGGKKGSGKKSYGRQMILNDIIEYIFFGRGYYYASTTDPQRRKTFIELLLQTINLLMLIESLSAQPKLRKKLLEELPKKIGKSFFKEPDMQKFHEALKLHGDDIAITNMKSKLSNKVEQLLVGTAGSSNLKKLNNYYDSLLPKTAGGLWNELIVFFYLLRRTAVHIIPLLLTQRVLSKDDMLKPPDYLVIHKKHGLFGIEVGGGKEPQSTNFMTKSGGKVVTTDLNNVPPRCPLCGEFILFCEKVIEDCCDIEENPLLRIKKEVRCIPECTKFTPKQILDGECPHTQYHGPLEETTKKQSKIDKDVKSYHFHYSCIKKIRDQTADSKIQAQYKKHQKDNKKEVTVLKTDYPYLQVSIDDFDKLGKDEIVCYGNYPNKDIKNCDVCDFRKDCEILSEAKKILGTSTTDKNAGIKLKKLLS